MNPDLIQHSQMRQGMYLAYEILKTACPEATKRFDARFRGLWTYACSRAFDDSGRLRETPPGYWDTDAASRRNRSAAERIPILVEALFTDLLSLHQYKNPLEVKMCLCEKELPAFFDKHFPDLDRRRAGYRNLKRICRELCDEAALVASPGETPAAAVYAGGPLLESENAAWRELLDVAARAARSKAPILLTGESGTGKEVLARFIHQASPRREGPFQAINCAALPEQTIESELFGHRKGAFTGADSSTPGLAIQADRGTLFLDEISETSPALQAKLLRFLQDHEVRPLGDVRAVRVDVRVLAATNAEPREALESGRLRRDLFYRLCVFHLQLPPLRERREDILRLADHFIAKYNLENDARVTGFDRDAAALLDRHDWPGNVRELENVVHRAVVLAGEGLIRVDHLPDAVTRRRASRTVSPPAPNILDRGALEKNLALALARTSKETDRPGRLGQTVPLSQIIAFFETAGARPFPPREFSDFISPPGRGARRDKLGRKILAALGDHGVIHRNRAASQAVRYRLDPAYLRQAGV